MSEFGLKVCSDFTALESTYLLGNIFAVSQAAVDSEADAADKRVWSRPSDAHGD